MGGTEDAATGILGEMAKPLSWGMPIEKVCEKLKKKDKQICELRYGEFFITYLVIVFYYYIGSCIVQAVSLISTYLTSYI